MIKHIVCWQLKGDESQRQAAIKWLEEKMAHLEQILPEIKSMKVGINHNEAGEYHVCVDEVFENDEEFNRYYYHPDHIRVRDHMSEASCGKMVFDYYF